GFSVLSGIKSELALDYFGLEPLMDTEFITAKTAALEKKLANMNRTDKKAVENQRLEQDILTALLHEGKKTNTCAFCGRSFPVSFLITAHIKKRSHCSHEERIDRRIVMPLCNMGCDQLYERGYLSVREGKVVPLRQTPTSGDMKRYLDEVIDNECLYFSDQTRLFFEWHWDFHQRKHATNALH
ncbi:hypothetical protein GP486_008893, partial [Trichoglossum hirsutum]